MEENQTAQTEQQQTSPERVLWPKRGDILMGRPLFHSDEGSETLSSMRHPVVVLAIAQKDNDPNAPVLAMVVPMTQSPRSLTKANHLPILPHQVHRVKAEEGKSSHICTDSPNIVVLSDPNNGLKRPYQTPDWVSPYTYGRIKDQDLVNAAESLTLSFIKETGYAPPIQGNLPQTDQSKAPTERRKLGTELPVKIRIAIVKAAADSIVSQKTLKKLGPALIRAGMEHRLASSSQNMLA